MNLQLQVALIALGSALVAAALGIAGNYYIQRKLHAWQRDQWCLDKAQEKKEWILEKKTAEYRELLSTLAQSVGCMAQNSIDFGMALPSLLSEEQRRLAFNEAAGEARRTIQDRIFISKRIQDEDIISMWSVLAGARDHDSFWDSWNRLHRVILKAAREELEIKGKLPEPV